MALKPCPECKAEVSTKAPSCPQCGAPIAKAREKAARQGCAGFALLVFGIILIGIFSGVGGDKKEGVQPDNTGSHDEQKTDTSTFFIDTKIRVKAGFYGCSNLNDLHKIKEMIWAKDHEAAERAAENASCNVIPAGTKGVVQDHSVWQSSSCIRQVGEPECIWVPDPIIEKDGQ